MTLPQLAVALAGLLLSAALGYGLLRRWQKRIRKSRFAEYGCAIEEFELPGEGVVKFARWLHPQEKPREITQAQVDALRRFVRPGDTAIDIGAYTGDTAVPLALAAGSEGCVIALEPNPHVFKVLAENAALNREKANIAPLNLAATEEDGTFTFNYCDASYCNGGFLATINNQQHHHPYELQVTGKNLPALLAREHADRLPRLSFIKVDAEGYDRRVLLSLQPLIEEHRPTVVCEVYKRLDRSEREALYDVLEALNYDCHKLGEPELQGEPVTRDTMMRWKHFDILALPRAA